MQTSPDGVDLIQRFEDCHLTAYVCPAGVPTIGWGHTGSDAQLGMTITQARADQLFRGDLKAAENAVSSLITGPLPQHRFDALVSFTYNVGPAALASSSLRRRLNAGEDPDTVAAQELPRWTKGEGDTVLPGLQRRRQAELKLFLSAPAGTRRDIRALRDTVLKKQPIDSSLLPPQQRVSIASGKVYAQAEILASRDRHTEVILPSGAGRWWAFDEHWSGLKEAPRNNPIAGVPYFYQNDNGPQGWRQCQSSTIAMALKFLGVTGFSDDADYARIVARYGDTTERPPHYSAMRQLGYTGAKFRMDLSAADIKAQIDKGRPVGVGALHNGPVTSPSGGGHFSLIYGYDATGWWVHDPYGSQDLVRGGFAAVGPTAGKAQHYSYANYSPRIFVSSPRDGWGWVFS